MNDLVAALIHRLKGLLTPLATLFILRPVNIDRRPCHGPPRVTIRGTSATPWFGRHRFRLPWFPKPQERVVFLIDGLNLHHSIRQAMQAFPAEAISPWVDVRALCEAQLHMISPTAVLCDLQYFMTIAEHLEPARPGIVQADRDYMDALTATGVSVHFGRFKRRRVRCATCRALSLRHEEKETDVAIAARLIELAVIRACEVVVLMSGDTDLIPAIHTARRLAPGLRIWIAFPFGRRNREVTYVADGTFKLAYQQYVQHRLPTTVTLPNGRAVKKPELYSYRS